MHILIAGILPVHIDFGELLEIKYLNEILWFVFAFN